MRVEGASKTIKRKSRKLKKVTPAKLKIKINKFSKEVKAKNKERLQKWKVSIWCYEYVKKSSKNMVQAKGFMFLTACDFFYYYFFCEVMFYCYRSANVIYYMF